MYQDIAEAMVKLVGQTSKMKWKKKMWDAIPVDEEGINRLLNYFMQRTPALIVTFEDVVYNPYEKNAGLTTAYTVEDPRFFTFVAVDSLRGDPQSLTEKMKTFSDDVKTRIINQDFDLAITPMQIVTEGRFMTTETLGVWSIQWTTAWTYRP